MTAQEGAHSATEQKEHQMLITAGVDVGSTQTKAVLIDDSRRIAGRALINTGGHVARAAERVFEEALRDAGKCRGEVSYVVGTGYGRFKVSFGDAQITEISCHAKGAVFLFPATRTVIDIGGQDAKGVRIGPHGEVEDFVMNDKCAAGTGRFLSNSAETLGLSLDAIGEISLRAGRPVRLSTVCSVFVESDIMAYLAQGRKVEDILAGVHSAIAARTIALVRRVGIEPEVTFTGGVSRNIGMVRALESKLAMPLNVSPESQFVGALGAALWGLERVEAGWSTVAERS
jgi:predicted CoA-substrate-specific enzyme activase